METVSDPGLYGLMAEFSGPERLLSAAEQAHQAGYRRMEAYTPYPVEGLAEAVGFRGTRLPLVIFGGGLTGFVAALVMQWYGATIDYPLNVAGRPLASWPAFIPITFELTVLFAGVTAVLGMLAFNGLPHPYHPVFNVPSFELATRNRFFLCIQADDPRFNRTNTATFLHGLGPLAVSEVPQ